MGKTNKSVNDLTSEIDLEHDLHDINETIVHAEEGNDDDNDHDENNSGDAGIDEMIDIESNVIISIPSDTDESEVTTSPKVKRKKTKRLQRRRTPKSLKRKKTNKSVNDLTSEIDLEHDLHDITETNDHTEDTNDDDNNHDDNNSDD